MALTNEEKKYTADEFLELAESTAERSELIDGKIYAMSSPSEIHQTIVTELTIEIGTFIRKNKGKCKIITAPFDVKLDESNVVIPDISVICDKSKLDGKKCNGAPDWVIEVVSSNWKDDYIRKLALYEKSGVREYWIVDPQKQRTFVWFFEEYSNIIRFFDFSQDIEVNIYRDKSEKLIINIDEML